MEYMVLTGKGTGTLAVRVNLALQDNWVLVGGVSVAATFLPLTGIPAYTFAQAMVRMNKEDKPMSTRDKGLFGSKELEEGLMFRGFLDFLVKQGKITLEKQKEMIEEVGGGERDEQ